MYIKSINIKNNGPIKAANIVANFNSDGTPIPLAIIGSNGAGKTLFIATIIDAIVEARRYCFEDLPEVPKGKYLRVSSKHYIAQSADYLHNAVTFQSTVGEFTFHEVVSKVSFEQLNFDEKDLESIAPQLRVDEKFRDSGFYKGFIALETHKKEISAQAIAYFPHFRYELPSWLNPDHNIDLVKSGGNYGRPNYNIVRATTIKETREWLANIILDREIYERVITDFPIQGAAIPPSTFKVFVGYRGPNTAVIELVNSLLLDILSVKDSQISAARLGFGRKSGRQISVFVTKNGIEELVAHDVTQLSSGQLMALSLGAEFIRAYEASKNALPDRLEDIDGIAIIDEIDLHLHVAAQYEVLPKLMRRFPKIQFIFTTHSPLFLLGMKRSGSMDLIQLPEGINLPLEEFGEFQEAYKLFLEKEDSYRTQYAALSKGIAESHKPILLTEGKTDWRHVKTALGITQSRGFFKSLDIQFFEFEKDMGDTYLSSMCKNYATLPQQNKIIFLFDRDNPQIVEEMSGEPLEFKNWGNNVFSLCLPIPAFRKDYKKISIELYYLDGEAKTPDPITSRRLHFSNEIEKSISATTKKMTIKVRKAPLLSEEYEKFVYDSDIESIKNSKGKQVALSKSAFVQSIVENLEISSEFDRSAFDELFEVIGRIIAI